MGSELQACSQVAADLTCSQWMMISMPAVDPSTYGSNFIWGFGSMASFFAIGIVGAVAISVFKRFDKLGDD